MIMVADDVQWPMGSGITQLADLPYGVAIKTGTPQVTADTFNSTILGYYPAEDLRYVSVSFLKRASSPDLWLEISSSHISTITISRLQTKRAILFFRGAVRVPTLREDLQGERLIKTIQIPQAVQPTDNYYAVCTKKRA